MASPGPGDPDTELPSYALASPQSESRQQQPEKPVASTSQPSSRPAERAYHLNNSKGTPWATLRVHSSAGSSSAVPRFYTGQDVAGSVDLNLVKKDNILSISVSVKGRIITGASSTESFTFFERHLTLWSKTTGVLPLVCTWPFAIPLPESVTLPGNPAEPHALQAFPLPQTFVERNIRASVQYDLALHFARGKFTMDSHLATAFLYASSAEPGAPSALRQRAYSEGTMFPGPEGDPEGWSVCDPVVIHGTVFNAHAVAVTCTLALATPVCYTKGSVIPCALSIACADAQALALLSTPTAIVVRLQRRVSYFIAASTTIAPQDVGWTHVVEDIATAAWWVQVGGNDDKGKAQVRNLEGEIVLPPDLKCSSCISRFSVSYSIALFPFSSAAFAAVDTDAAVLVRPVEVVALYGPGPHPKGFSPPGYVDGRSAREKRLSEFMAVQTWQPSGFGTYI